MWLWSCEEVIIFGQNAGNSKFQTIGYVDSNSYGRTGPVDATEVVRFGPNNYLKFLRTLLHLQPWRKALHWNSFNWRRWGGGLGHTWFSQLTQYTVTWKIKLLQVGWMPLKRFQSLLLAEKAECHFCPTWALRQPQLPQVQPALICRGCCCITLVDLSNS